MFLPNILLFTLLTIFSLISAEPVITAWYELSGPGIEPSFNIRFDPLRFAIQHDSNLRIFFPSGNIQMFDRREMKCSVFSDKNRRYSWLPDIKTVSKYGNAKASHLDVILGGFALDVDVNNLLIRCYGFQIDDKALQAAINNTFVIFLDEERRQYTLVRHEDGLLSNGDRF